MTATSSSQRKCSSVAWAFGGADEQPIRADPALEMLESHADRPVERADRLELLEVGDDPVLVVVLEGGGPLEGLEPLGVLDVHALGPLEEREVAERRLAEREQLDADARRVGVGRHREVGAGEARRRADRRQQVLDEREVEHLLGADLEQRLAPALDRDELLRRSRPR